MEEKIAKVVASLVSMTEDGKLEWKYTNTENSFSIELDSASLVISYTAVDPFSMREDIYELTMYNGTGKPIELVSLGKSDAATGDYSMLSKLYNLAKEATNKKNSTLDKVLNELSLMDLPF